MSDPGKCHEGVKGGKIQLLKKLINQNPDLLIIKFFQGLKFES